MVDLLLLHNLQSKFKLLHINPKIAMKHNSGGWSLVSDLLFCFSFIPLNACKSIVEVLAKSYLLRLMELTWWDFGAQLRQSAYVCNHFEKAATVIG